MKRYLLDTNALSDFVNHRKGVDERVHSELKKRHVIGTGTPAYAELRYGIEYSQSRDRNLQQLKRFMKRLTFWPFDVKAAEEYGRLTAHMIRAGRPMQIPDLQIAAIALTIGNCTVVSSDTDLSAVPGLSVEDWSAS
jgi:tRNA(fMet)-specific endonuclease VapC